VRRVFFLSLCSALFFCGCGRFSRKPPAPVFVPKESAVTIAFQSRTANPSHPAYSATLRAIARFQKKHPEIAVILSAESSGSAREPVDLALIEAGQLAERVGKGGVEPLGARLSAEWLKGFSQESLSRCKAGGVLFAVPWMESKKPGDDWLLISFALSLRKPEAVELMKFLVSDPMTLEEMSRATGLRPAKHNEAGFTKVVP